MITRIPSAFSAIAVLSVTPALASGFGFYEQGAKASGQAGAWVARADDASANWYNPAALVYLEGGEVQFGLNYLDVGSDTQFSPAPGVSIEAVSSVETPAQFYYSQKVNDHVAWGVGLNNPFGLVSEWDDPPVTFFSRRSELRTYLLNPNVAFKLSRHCSLAFGADYLAVEVRDYSRDTLGGLVNLAGEGDAWGYNVAVQFKDDRFSLAAQARSSMKATIGGSFLGASATADLHLPAQVMLGAAWTGKRVDIEAGAYNTQWNYFNSLDVLVGSPINSTIGITEHWEATWSYRLGVAIRLGKAMRNELRFGGVRDNSPIPAAYLRPSIPDADRTGYTLGYGYQSQRWGLDVYVMQLDFDDITANGSPADGVINGTYTSSILLSGVSAKFRF